MPARSDSADDGDDGGAGGAGGATVSHDGQQYEFVVIQCLRDEQSFDQTVLELQADGVPVDTPPELLDDLLGAADADADVLALLEPVLEYGPVLSVSRAEGGGDFVAVFQTPDIIVQTDGGVADDPSARFLDIAEDGSTVAGTTTAVGGGEVALEMTCP